LRGGCDIETGESEAEGSGGLIANKIQREYSIEDSFWVLFG
jgi:hypothetical protein